MASDSPRDLQNTVTKAQTAALGFRVKSGWAAVVLLIGTARSPQLSDIGRIELCDPRHPETRQPYHAAMGELETDSTTLNQRERVVRGISQESLTRLLNCYQQKDFRSSVPRLWWEARPIQTRSEIRISERMLSKAAYFGRSSRRLCRTIRFAVSSFSKAMLTPEWLRD